jgi:formylglycine-generating enzyme
MVRDRASSSAWVPALLLAASCARPAARDELPPAVEVGPQPTVPAHRTAAKVTPSAVASSAPSPSGDVTAAVPASPCPSEMALVGKRICVDRWEAMTLDERGEQHSPHHAVGAKAVRAVSRTGELPQAYISYEQAGEACNRSGKRLCTTAEWLDACQGVSRPKRRYPYGPRLEVLACNTEHSSHPVLLLTEGRHRTDSSTLNDSRINQMGGGVAPAGAFERCTTPEGVHDLVGNLLEWTKSDRPLLMGGYYLDAEENGDGCGYVTMLHGPQYHDFTTGFRCCRKPDVVAAPAPPQAGAAAPAAPLVPGVPASRDPHGFRSFENAFSKLPPAPPPPAYEPPTAACPIDMALVDGVRCSVPVQVCKRWLDAPDKPQRSCAQFAEPTRCDGRKHDMRYCIDRYEFTPPGYSLPIVHVAYTEAQLLCGAMGKRLCTEQEWEFACEGPEAVPYPYGFVRDGAVCNHDAKDALFTPFGKLVDQRAASESLAKCRSPFGVFNLVGNVDEWTTRTENEPPRRSILRGGWWLQGRNRCRAATDSHSETYAGPQTGFRCCKPARR